MSFTYNYYDITGALLGFLSSLSLLFWMSFGKPRPSAKKLSLSVESCNSSIENIILHSNSSLPTINSTRGIGQSSSYTKIVNNEMSKDDYFYLYRISYVWYALICFMVTFSVGFIVSFIYNKIKHSRNSHRQQ